MTEISLGKKITEFGSPTIGKISKRNESLNLGRCEKSLVLVGTIDIV